MQRHYTESTGNIAISNIALPDYSFEMREIAPWVARSGLSRRIAEGLAVQAVLRACHGETENYQRDRAVPPAQLEQVLKKDPVFQSMLREFVAQGGDLGNPKGHGAITAYRTRVKNDMWKERKKARAGGGCCSCNADGEPSFGADVKRFMVPMNPSDPTFAAPFANEEDTEGIGAEIDSHVKLTADTRASSISTPNAQAPQQSLLEMPLGNEDDARWEELALQQREDPSSEPDAVW
ncbi:hypothetical protein Q8F55_003826 [Vanrija albida]|uniref:Uncharacterized protein n=1 Tax=Vanrija albida TaxID=181172 RepID=A0ABR3Q5E1_9TREE